MEDWGNGKLEGQEEVESVMRRHWRILGTRSREKELERDLEGDPEIVLEVDVELNLQ